MFVKILILLGLSIGSGALGRCGGAEGHSKLWRRIGCSIIAVVAFCIVFGFQMKFWWVYLIMFGLHWGAFSTYHDYLSEDNFWVSGFVVGLALLPSLFIGHFLWFILIRSFVLAVIWGCLNKYLPQRVFIWRKDVAEEFLRYASSY